MLRSSSLVVLALVTPAMALLIQPDRTPPTIAGSSPEQIMMQTKAIWAKSVERASTMTQKVAVGNTKNICEPVHEPSKANYKLWKPGEEWFGGVGQDKRLVNLLNGTTGFFVESGAGDGDSTVDVWSLDMESVEGKILQSFNFMQIKVGVLVIEMNKLGETNEQIAQSMKSNGFHECGKVLYDRIHTSPSYFNKHELQVPRAPSRLC